MNRPKLIILCGIPGSGKSTYAKNCIERNANAIHLSSDAIRNELYGDENIQGNPGDIFSLMQKRAVEALNNGRDVLYDATNITRKDRAGIISVCPKFAKIECHIVWAPIETCLERDANRDRTVGKEVIDRMLKRFQAVYYDEGVDEIKVIKPDDFSDSIYTNTLFNLMQIPHDNPHHTLNIFDHCLEANKYIVKKTGEYYSDIGWAAIYHDIGKPYVKAFIDSKGNISECAHYYQHQCLSAHLSYGLLNATPKVSWLISTHMEPYFNSKYFNNLPLFLRQ